MNFDKGMSYLSAAFVTKVTNAVIREFQKQSTYFLSDDAGLKSCWDEICVIVQEGDFLENEIIDSVDGLIKEKIEKLKPDGFILCAVWMQTMRGMDWLAEHESQSDIQPIYDLNDVIEYIRQEVLSKAMNWTNKRIERFADKQYEFDGGYY